MKQTLLRAGQSLIIVTAFLLPAIALAAPAELTLKNVLFDSKLDASTIKVKSVDGTAETMFKIAHPATTRVTGGPRGLTPYDDWTAGDPLIITGTPAGYSEGMLQISAKTIAYGAQGFIDRTLTGNVVGKDMVADKLYVAIRTTSKFILDTIDHAGAVVARGAGLDTLAIGDRVIVREIWKKVGNTTTKIKTGEVKRAPSGTREVVVSVVKNGTAYAVDTGYPTTLTLPTESRIWLQNDSNDPLYLRLSSADRTFFWGLRNEYMLIPARAVRMVSVVKKTGALTLALTTQNEGSPTAVVSVPLTVVAR